MGMRSWFSKVFRTEKKESQVRESSKAVAHVDNVDNFVDNSVLRDSSGIELVKQPGGGALRRGGGPRKPTAIQAIKENMRRGLDEENLQMLLDILQSPRDVKCPECGAKVKPPVDDKTKVAVADLLAKHGLKEDKEGEKRYVLEIDL